jgi:membrane associated rhomboid family serine protease
MNSGNQYRMHVPVTPMVKWLLISNVSVWFFFQVILEGYFKLPFTSIFALYPGQVVLDFKGWQLLSYMFLHSLSISHILLNMLSLWFIGAELEQRWGPRFFLLYFLGSGVGAALFYCIAVTFYYAFTGKQSLLLTPVVGASGGVFGLLLAYGLLFGERTLSFFMLFPMKAKYFVMILGAVEVMTLLSTGVMGGEIANLAHLGGLLAGFLILWTWTRLQRYKATAAKENRFKKAGGLRLVVDNDKKPGDKGGPKYWN